MSARPLALVTGASAGFGELFARRLAAEGYDLVLVARRAGRLEALSAAMQSEHGARVEVLAADLVVDADRQRVEQRLAAAPAIDLFVNNAGLGHYGAFADHDPDALSHMIHLNVLAVSRLSRAALPPMLARGSGTILHVASLAAFQPTPHCAVYGATKAFVLSLTEAMAEEVRGSGVRLQALCPGYSRTEFQEGASTAQDVLPDAAWTRPEDIVDYALRKLRRPGVIGVPGFGNWVVSQAAPVFPRSWVRRVSGWINGRFSVGSPRR